MGLNVIKLTQKLYLMCTLEWHLGNEQMWSFPS